MFFCIILEPFLDIWTESWKTFRSYYTDNIHRRNPTATCVQIHYVRLPDHVNWCHWKHFISRWTHAWIQFKAVLLMTTNKWKWDVKHFHLSCHYRRAFFFFLIFFSTDEVHGSVGTQSKMTKTNCALNCPDKCWGNVWNTIQMNGHRYKWVQSFIRNICT